MLNEILVCRFGFFELAFITYEHNLDKYHENTTSFKTFLEQLVVLVLLCSGFLCQPICLPRTL